MFDPTSSVLHTQAMQRIVVGLNLGVAALTLWLHLSGVITGVTLGRLRTR